MQEVTVGEIAGIHALYGAAELADVDMFLFTSQNGVDCFMDNVFASKLDVRALGNAKIAAIGSKTAERLKNYGLRADFVPEISVIRLHSVWVILMRMVRFCLD